MKKERLNYFDEFIKDANIAFQTANILDEYIENFNGEISDEKEQMVHKLENEADHILHNILNYLTKDFVPPIDRNDIIMLSHAIDDLEDNIDEVVINIDIFGIDNVCNDTKYFTSLIKIACGKIEERLIKFKSTKKYNEIHKFVVEINEIEDKGDKAYQKAVRDLFNNEKNPIEVIKWKNIYNCLENCIDSCEKIANCIEEIIVKLN